MRAPSRLVVGVLCGVVGALLLQLGVLESAEWKSWDWRVRAFASGEPSTQVAILAVDQSSLDFMADEQGLSWPWPRSLYVPLLEYCRSAGARGVIFDVFYTEFSSYGVADDEEFAGSVGSAPDVTLAVGVHAGDQGSGELVDYAPPVSGDIKALAQPFETVTTPVEPLLGAARGLGNVNFVPDSDGIFRRMPVAFTDGMTTVLALPWAAAALGGAQLAVQGTQLTANDTPVPLQHGQLIIPYRKAGSIPSYSAASAVQSFIRMQEGGEIALDPALLQDRFVLVGLTAPGLLDLRPTPISAVFPGVEVQATVLDAILRGAYITPAPQWLGLLLCVLAALLMTAVLTVVRGAWSSTLALPVVLLLPVVGAVLGYQAGYWIPVAGPVTGGLLAFLGVRTLDYATEGRQRRFLKQAFRHYLSPAVVEELVKDPSRLKLGGERKELTIFFSDLEGFTTLSEKISPDKLTAMLNRYLSEMTDVIQASGGTVDKYVGDAIVAFWNAPLDQPDHARRGVTASIQCLERLDAINPELERLTGFPLRMRIGVHTGTVVVGNLGSSERFDYSMIGDAANLASRLEGLGKVFKSPVIVSEAAWHAAGEGFTGREIGKVQVVGRSEPVRVYQPGSQPGSKPLFPWWPGTDDPFASGLKLLYSGDPAAAKQHFERAAATGDPVAEIYVTRCSTLASGESGTWTMHSK